LPSECGTIRDVDDSPNAVPEVTAEINMSLAAVGDPEPETDTEAGTPDQEEGSPG
jgi:hypothetical protein